MNVLSQDAHRTSRPLQCGAFGAVVVAAALLLYDVSTALLEQWPSYARPALVLCPLVAMVSMDFLTGLFHFFGDRFGSAETRLWGTRPFLAFREHHVHPHRMTENDYVQVNGHSALVSLPPLVLAYVLLPVDRALWAALAGAVLAPLALGMTFAANQLHKWAHTEHPPRAIAWMQKVGLVLSPEHHQRHHTPPYDSHFCVAFGWMNPLLERVRFFPRLERLLRWATVVGGWGRQ